MLHLAEETAGMLTVKVYPSNGVCFNFGDVVAGEVRSSVSRVFKDRAYFAMILKDGFSVRPGAYAHNIV